MASTFSEIPILAVWEPVHSDDWGPDEARHFLERAGFSSTKQQIEEVVDLGPEGSCERFFASSPFELPPWIMENLEEFERLKIQARETDDREKRRELNDARNQVARQALLEIEYEWLLRASRPESGFSAKWELFLSDVWVVGKRAVRDPNWQFSYWQNLAEKSHLQYPQFAKDFSREPAMVKYLNLDQSSKAKPNENFARELFELFTLGEGNYTEDDIKEAARAFTGRRLYGGSYKEVERVHDNGVKTVFSSRGRWTGDDVIDLVFQQPAARTFLPSEAIRFYMTRDPLPQDHIKLLGDLWAEEDFRLDALRRRLLTSRGFFASNFQGSRIKSPVELFIGSLQQFGLQPAPLPDRTVRPLRDMGQELFEPPNVRGWIGGEAWINAGKLAARRTTVDLLFTPIPFKRLNADDKMRVERERERDGARPFYINGQELIQLAGATPDEVIDFIQNYLLSQPLTADYVEQIRSFLGPKPSTEKIQTVILTTLQSPQYQLN